VADFAIERALWRRGLALVAGVDEAGRGPLAGPVVAAAVVLPHDWPPALALDDSKRLSAAVRERLFAEIRRRALAWRAVAMMAPEIDRVNIGQATLLCMARAVQRLGVQPQHVLVDGNRLPVLALPAEALVKGDGRSASVAAASIVAKVVRDRWMEAYGRRFPQWGFGQHKGYGTRRHRDLLARLGPSPIHRRSFHVKGEPWPEAAQPAKRRSGGGRSVAGAKPLRPGF